MAEAPAEVDGFSEAPIREAPLSFGIERRRDVKLGSEIFGFSSQGSIGERLLRPSRRATGRKMRKGAGLT